jgi:hypothetical protein
MATLSSFLEAARYDLIDYETGLEYEDRELINYLNRMISLIDSTLLVNRSDLLHGEETNIDTVASQNYVDLTDMNNTYWDSVREVWIGTNRLEPISVPFMYYKRKWYSADAEPQFFAVEGNHLLFETTADAAHTDLVIYYNKKTRPRLESWTDTFTATTATDIITPATAGATFTNGDGRFQFTNSGGALPTGLSTSTDYWLIYDASNGNASYQVASSKSNAVAGTEITISTTGSGTHTATLTEYTPYYGRYDNFLREMLVMHGRGKKEGGASKSDAAFQSVFRKRMFEEEVRRGFQEPNYYLGF